MRTIANRPVFQGDVMILRIDAIPNTAIRADATHGKHVVAHSETQHHHVVDAGLADRFIDQMNSFISYLNVASDVELTHLRSFDTHEPILLTPGTYIVRQQREYVAKGFRRAAD